MFEQGIPGFELLFADITFSRDLFIFLFFLGLFLPSFILFGYFFSVISYFSEFFLFRLWLLLRCLNLNDWLINFFGFFCIFLFWCYRLLGSLVLFFGWFCLYFFNRFWIFVTIIIFFLSLWFLGALHSLSSSFLFRFFLFNQLIELILFLLI